MRSQSQTVQPLKYNQQHIRVIYDDLSEVGFSWVLGAFFKNHQLEL